jgi:hypothetical protein
VLAINVYMWTGLFYQFLTLIYKWAIPDAGYVKIPSVGLIRQIEKTQRLILTWFFLLRFSHLGEKWSGDWGKAPNKWITSLLLWIRFCK